MLMELTSAALISGSLAALCFGMSKTGVPGFGLLGVTLMTLAFPGQEKLSTGAVLPLLVVADLLAVGYYIRDCDWSKIKLLVLPVAIGLGIGAAVLDCLDASLFRIVLGSIVLAMIVLDQARNLLGWNGCPGSKRRMRGGNTRRNGHRDRQRGRAGDDRLHRFARVQQGPVHGHLRGLFLSHQHFEVADCRDAGHDHAENTAFRPVSATGHSGRLTDRAPRLSTMRNSLSSRQSSTAAAVKMLFG